MGVHALSVNPFSPHRWKNNHYAHFILNAVHLQPIDGVGVHFVFNLDIQIAVVPGIWRARKSSGDLFPGRDPYGILGIEDRLSSKRSIE